MRTDPSAALPPARQNGIEHRLLLYQAVGCLLLIAVSWLDELLDLPTLIFGSAPGHNWHEAMLETGFILGVAAPVFWLTRRLVKRLVYLENFLRVCAWCRKIGVDDEWVSLEQYFHHELKTLTSHGMCPECFEKLEWDLGQQTGQRE